MNQKQFSRREFLQILGATAVAGAAWQLGVHSWEAGLTEVSVSRVLMGTVVNLTVIGEDKAAVETAVSATFDQMSRLEALLSRHQPDSELSQLNRNGRLANASQSLLELIQQAHQLSEQTNGAFDITVKPLGDLYQAYAKRGELPSETAVAQTLPLVNYKNIDVNGTTIQLIQPNMGITLDGIGKGYIVDAGTAVLKQHGFTNILVEAGGDLMAAGVNARQQSWHIGLQPPRPQTETPLTRFSLRNQAAATSGDYMQPFITDLSQHHILDPRTGYLAPELASVTVVAPTVVLADGLATAVMALGRLGLDLIEGTAHCEALAVAKDGGMLRTSGFGVV